MFLPLRALALVLLVPANGMIAADRPLPHLEKRGAVMQLIVDGNPYLILGGELHNSSGSKIEYLRPIGAQLAQLNLDSSIRRPPVRTAAKTSARTGHRPVPTAPSRCCNAP